MGHHLKDLATTAARMATTVNNRCEHCRTQTLCSPNWLILCVDALEAMVSYGASALCFPRPEMAWANDDTARLKGCSYLVIEGTTFWALSLCAHNLEHCMARRIWGACEGNQRRADKAFLQALGAWCFLEDRELGVFWHYSRLWRSVCGTAGFIQRFNSRPLGCCRFMPFLHFFFWVRIFQAFWCVARSGATCASLATTKRIVQCSTSAPDSQPLKHRQHLKLSWSDRPWARRTGCRCGPRNVIGLFLEAFKPNMLHLRKFARRVWMFAAGRGYRISVCDRSIKDQFLATFEAARRSAKTTWNNFNTTRGLQKVGVQYDDGECRMSSTDGRIVCIASLLLWSAFLLHDGICARQEDSWLKPALQKHPDVKSSWFFNAVGDSVRWICMDCSHASMQTTLQHAS